MDYLKYCCLFVVLSASALFAVNDSETESSWWEDAKNAVVENSDTMADVSSVLSDVAKGVGGPVGIALSSVLALSSVVFAGISRINKKKVLTEKDKRELVTQALRATIATIDAYKKTKTDTGNESDKDDVSVLDRILKEQQDSAGSAVSELIKSVMSDKKSD